MINPDDPAFTIMPTADFAQQMMPHPGMSLRTYAAIQAMNGLLACDEVIGSKEKFSEWSVLYADALVAELNKPRTP